MYIHVYVMTSHYMYVHTHQDKGGMEENKEEADEDEGEAAADVIASPPPVLGLQTLREDVSILLEPLGVVRVRGAGGAGGGREVRGERRGEGGKEEKREGRDSMRG